MKFRYKGYNRLAKVVSGEIEAGNAQEARAKLRGQMISPMRLQAVAQGVTGRGGMLGGLELFNNPAPELTEFTAFIRQLATMQAAGIPIVQALGVLSEQTPHRGFGEVLADVQKRIQEGTNLTDALKRHPRVFDRVFLNLVAAGEVSGSLDKVLQRLAIHYEKANKLRAKIKSAMTYPTLILVVVTVIVIGLMMFVVPTFAELFTSQGKALPGPTQVIMSVSKWFRTQWYVVFGGIAAFIGFIWFCATNEQVRRSIDPVLLKVPLFGPLIQKVAIARFSRTLGTMVQAGVPILEALSITARVAGNYAIEDAIHRTRQSITEGNSIAAPLQAAKVFPQMAVSMIAIGEQTGALDEMLTKIAEFYEDEVDAAVSAMTSILEPLMIVIVGIVVAGILIPMYLPIFKLGDIVN